MRKVFFSFHYQRDFWRVNQVRNSWLTQGDASRFLDGAEWEKIERQGDRVVKKWIDEQMRGTSVTAVLIGRETSERKYVKYELEQSYKLGKGVLGIYIHDLKDRDGQTEWFGGSNPLGEIVIGGSFLFPRTLADTCQTYNWVSDRGYSNFSSWIEDAIQLAKRKTPIVSDIWL